MSRHEDAGTIQSFDQGDRKVLLSNGRSYTLMPGVDMTTLRAGDYVRITADGQLADSVVKSSPNHPMPLRPVEEKSQPALHGKVNTTKTMKETSEAPAKRPPNS